MMPRIYEVDADAIAVVVVRAVEETKTFMIDISTSSEVPAHFLSRALREAAQSLDDDTIEHVDLSDDPISGVSDA